jgi:hypothetical protein
MKSSPTDGRFCPTPNEQQFRIRQQYHRAKKTQNYGSHLTIFAEFGTLIGHAEGKNVAMEQYRITVDGRYERLLG